jgi:hypothetical protein
VKGGVVKGGYEGRRSDGRESSPGVKDGGVNGEEQRNEG